MKTMPRLVRIILFVAVLIFVIVGVVGAQGGWARTWGGRTYWFNPHLNEAGARIGWTEVRRESVSGEADAVDTRLALADTPAWWDSAREGIGYPAATVDSATYHRYMENYAKARGFAPTPSMSQDLEWRTRQSQAFDRDR